MNEVGFRFLRTDAGQEALRDATEAFSAGEPHLAVASRLRKLHEPARVQAVIETVTLRTKALRKFSHAKEMYFTRDGLEQATAEPVARHRARRIANGGYSTLADLGCGIGGDALALAATADVVAVDFERVNLFMALANASVYGVAERLWPVQADLLEMAPIPIDAFCFDPARRTPSGTHIAPGRRLHSVEEYLPPLSLIERWRRVVPSGVVKVSPAIDYDEIPSGAEIEFVSLDGELREGVLWFGDLRSGATRVATCLPSGASLSNEDVPTMTADAVTISAPRAFLYEPDPAIIRAHLVRHLAHLLDAALIDPSIAFLTADSLQATPFARPYAVEDVMTFQLKRLRHYLRQHHIGRVTIKKRGSPLDPDDLRRALRLQGSEHRYIFLTQSAGLPIVVIARDVDTLTAS